MQTVAAGAVHVADPVIRKTCLRVFRELTDQWILPQKNEKQEGQQQSIVRVDPNVQHGLRTILYQTVLPGVLLAMCQTDFDPRDAQQNESTQ